MVNVISSPSHSIRLRHSMVHGITGARGIALIDYSGEGGTPSTPDFNFPIVLTLAFALHRSPPNKFPFLELPWFSLGSI